MTKPKHGGIYIERELYLSDAFLSLNKNAVKVLIALLDIRKRESKSQARDKKGARRTPRYTNLNNLEMPYKTLQKKFKIPQQGITKAIDELMGKGFIDIRHHGGMGEHDKTIYALIDDYLRWTPGMVFKKRERDIRRGYQGKLMGAVKKKLAHKIIPLYTHENHTLPEDLRTQNHTLSEKDKNRTKPENKRADN